MNTTEKQDTDTGTDWPIGERIALWSIVAMITYLIIAQ